MKMFCDPWLTRQFGGRRGLLRYLATQGLRALGHYRPYTEVRWYEVRRLVFVCKGNICRSAYGEARARALGMASASLGLEAEDGRPANAIAVRQAAARALSLETHRTRRVRAELLDTGDLVLCMEPRQAQAMRAHLRDGAQQLSLLGLWAGARLPLIEDPYGLDDAYWHTCLDVIDDALLSLRAQWSATPAL